MTEDKADKELLAALLFLSKLFHLWYYSDAPTAEQLIALDEDLIK